MLMTPFCYSSVLMSLSKYSHIISYLELGFQHKDGRGDTIKL